jgi:hypothetical protein
MFNSELQRVMGADAQTHPGAFKEIANIFGYKKVEDMVQAVYRTSNKALWSYSDALSLTRIMELEASGLSRSQAIEKMEKVMPNYRVPTRVAGQRALSTTLQNPMFSYFGRYQYNRLKAYANIAKDLAGKEKDTKTRAEALDKLAMLGFLATVYYPVMDQVYRKITGNQDASVTRPGMLAVPQAGEDIASGKKTYGQAAQTLVSPGILEAPLEMAMDKDFYTGKDIVDRQDLSEGNFGRAGYDFGKYALSKFSPAADVQGLMGKKDLPEFLGKQIGVNLPTDEELASIEKAKKYSRQQQKSDAKKRGF